jgi:hypothetical protein
MRIERGNWRNPDLVLLLLKLVLRRIIGSVTTRLVKRNLHVRTVTRYLLQKLHCTAFEDSNGWKEIKIFVLYHHRFSAASTTRCRRQCRWFQKSRSTAMEVSRNCGHWFQKGQCLVVTAVTGFCTKFRRKKQNLILPSIYGWVLIKWMRVWVWRKKMSSEFSMFIKNKLIYKFLILAVETFNCHVSLIY